MYDLKIKDSYTKCTNEISSDNITKILQQLKVYHITKLPIATIDNFMIMKPFDLQERVVGLKWKIGQYTIWLTGKNFNLEEVWKVLYEV